MTTSPQGSLMIDFEALSSKVKALEAEGKRCSALYTVPVHGNPTAICKTREEKKQVSTQS